jgi:pimeloyl-ACP methyl ester carboxylesterase
LKAYFISGLGADKKAFYRLQLPAGYEPVYLDWIFPLPKESLTAYATRFSLLINDKEKFILVGLSFGGMVACEIARLMKPEKLILISSIAVSDELPWYFKKAGTLRLQKIIPAGFYKTATLLNHFMGSTMKEEKVMVLSFVRKTDSAFIQWAVNAILQWKYRERFNNLIHIHGNRDRLLPVKYTNADYVIRGGRHLMVWNKATEINKILQEVLRETDQPSNN